jgi:porin
MLKAFVGGLAASLLVGAAAPAALALQDPPKPAAKPEEKAPAKAPEKMPLKTPSGAPSSSGGWTTWDTATGDWGGKRKELAEKGFRLDARYENEFTRVQTGGARPHNNADRYKLDATLTVDLGKAFDLPGYDGRIVATYWQFGGENGTADLGSVNDISTIESGSRQELAELYYAATLGEGRWSLVLGKSDLLERFAASPVDDDFLNLGHSFAPTQRSWPRAPETAAGGEAWFRNKGFAAGLGVYDGSKMQGVATGQHGTGTLLGPPSDMFLVGEAGYRWKGDGSARVAGGYWKHTGDFPEFGSATMDQGAVGWYALADGRVWRPRDLDRADPRGAYLLMRWSRADEESHRIHDQVSATVSWRGPIRSRKDDAAGIGWIRGAFSPDLAPAARYSHEEIVEATYRFQWTRFAALTGSLSYFGNPGGTFEDAVVLGLRLTVDF